MRNAALAATLVSSFLITSTATFAQVNHGDFLGADVDFLQVTETTQTPGDPATLWGAPAIAGAGNQLIFFPGAFLSSCSQGASDITSSLLTATISAPPNNTIDMLTLAETGDVTLTKFPPFGDPTTNASASVGGFLTVIEDLGGPIVPVVIPFAGTFVPTSTFSLPGDFGASAWQGSFSIDVAAVVPNATKAVLALDNTLDSNCGAGVTTAKIQKKVVSGPSAAIIVNDPPDPVQEIELFEPLSLNEPGQDHTVTAVVTELAGAAMPLAGVLVSFEVISGPNTGSSGDCTINADCTTDGDGMVFFTYPGDGGPGVDEIQASFVDNVGDTVVSDPVLKFWDLDCNTNDIPDTCDLDVAGFAGACAEFPGSGGSLDSNGDGVPDECNTPPECSNASAEPDELWPANGAFKDIAIAGVTDVDGDPISVMITAIYQDEPVQGAGDGTSSPDATGVGTGTASVRAERSGTQLEPGNGRVYHVSFYADDGVGGACSGEVTVCVPHDKRPGHACVDEGALFDSTDDGGEPHRRGPCGLGFELAFLLPALMWLNRRRRRVAA